MSACVIDILSKTWWPRIAHLRATRVTIFFLLCTVIDNKLGMGHPCGYPGKPRNGTSHTEAEVSRAGDTAQYNCNPGFTLFGNKERVCLSSGIWAGTQPICHVNLVLNSTTIMSAQLWNYRPQLAVDGSSETCAFTPRTSEQRWWQVELPSEQYVGSVSLTINKDAYHELTVFVIEIISRSEALYKPCVQFKGNFHTQEMFFECRKPRGIKGRFIYVRDDRKEHDFFGLCEVGVYSFRDELSCGDPEQPVSSVVTVVGNVAMYSCLPGHTLDSSPNRTCLPGGRWEGHAPQCKAITCEMPPALKNTTLELLNSSTSWNSLVAYTCIPGFYHAQNGPNQWVLQCLDTSQWQKSNNTCISDQDRNLPVIIRENDHRLGEYEPILGTTIAIATMSVLGSLTILASITTVVLLIRRDLMRRAYRTPKNSTNDLLNANPDQTQTGDTATPSEGATSEVVTNSEVITPIEVTTLSDHEAEAVILEPVEFEPRDSEGEVVYSTIELTSRYSKYPKVQEATTLGTVREEADVQPFDPVSSEFVTLYAQLDMQQRDSTKPREPCKVGKNCDCAKYFQPDHQLQCEAKARKEVLKMLPQFCLMPATMQEKFDPTNIMHTITTDKL